MTQKGRQGESAGGRVLAAPSGTPDWEARTDWIADSDGRPYQWVVRWSDGALHLATRRRGSRHFDPVGSIGVRDAAPLAALLHAAANQAPGT